MTIGTHRVTLGGQPKEIHWDKQKDAQLRIERGLGFGSIAEKLGRDAYLAVVDHWNQARYPGQRVFVVDVDGYAQYVPFVESPGKIFLKTIFPSRKATRLYLRVQ